MFNHALPDFIPWTDTKHVCRMNHSQNMDYTPSSIHEQGFTCPFGWLKHVETHMFLVSTAGPPGKSLLLAVAWLPGFGVRGSVRFSWLQGGAAVFHFGLLSTHIFGHFCQFQTLWRFLSTKIISVTSKLLSLSAPEFLYHEHVLLVNRFGLFL
jgi:TM2 domain-containing membrane protein YozV